jgi:tripartite-type tricarboxylate transporter receptor subunit TctC
LETILVKTLFWRGIGAFILALAGTNAAVAADPFPTRPVRIIVNTAPGGLTDVVTRLIAQQMSETLKQSVIVENRAGGDGLIGIRAVKSAPADGYTLLGTAGTIALQMTVREDPGYDLLKDFTGIGLMGRSPFLMVVAPSQPDNTLADFIARAKANPGKLSYASQGVGSTAHLSAAQLEVQAGIKMVHVPYRGAQPALTDIVAGHVDVFFDTLATSVPLYRDNKVKLIGVADLQRAGAVPEVPTFSEAGLPGFRSVTWFGTSSESSGARTSVTCCAGFRSKPARRRPPASPSSSQMKRLSGAR